ncbi:putative toxin-antitoxin system toxin component, PIN family [Microcoleus sp. B4-C1]|uniref:putative toxin-antitoxin system toxin component, PIN family n=1 Tax=Microcoleus sp. B4-C1 TaxID=2818660 RepID=UPI002FD60FBF
MRVVIDTNILVSAAIAGRKPASVISWVINQPDYEWVVSEEILAEYQEVLSRRKLKLTDVQKQRWLNLGASQFGKYIKLKVDR